MDELNSILKSDNHNHFFKWYYDTITKFFSHDWIFGGFIEKMIVAGSVIWAIICLIKLFFSLF